MERLSSVLISTNLPCLAIRPLCHIGINSITLVKGCSASCSPRYLIGKGAIYISRYFWPKFPPELCFRSKLQLSFYNQLILSPEASPEICNICLNASKSKTLCLTNITASSAYTDNLCNGWTPGIGVKRSSCTASLMIASTLPSPWRRTYYMKTGKQHTPIHQSLPKKHMVNQPILPCKTLQWLQKFTYKALRPWSNEYISPDLICDHGCYHLTR
jgi:hypothetical protein